MWLYLFVPRSLRKEQPHAAEVGDPGKDEPRTDKSRQGEEAPMNKPSQQNAREHERSGRDPDLAFQADDFDSATIDREAGFDP